MEFCGPCDLSLQLMCTGWDFFAPSAPTKILQLKLYVAPSWGLCDPSDLLSRSCRSERKCWEQIRTPSPTSTRISPWDIFKPGHPQTLEDLVSRHCRCRICHFVKLLSITHFCWKMREINVWYLIHTNILLHTMLLIYKYTNSINYEKVVYFSWSSRQT